jgi:hypothetical protein
MAMPQTGQWRMRGRGCAVNFRPVKNNNDPASSANTAALELIQINVGSQALRRTAAPAGAAAAGAQNYDLGQCSRRSSLQNNQMWQNVSTAPFDRDLQLAVIDNDGPHALVFPCRRIPNGWMKVDTKERLDVRPTHWREWREAQEDRSEPLKSKHGSA